MKTALITSLLAAAFTARAADSVVNFNNNVFRLSDGSQDPNRLVRFDLGASWGPLVGTGVRNGVRGTASYVAQLFLVGAGGVETPVAGTANFREATTTEPGTWTGGIRTLVGVAPGTPVNLVVKVWDTSVPSYEAAAATGAALGSGKSTVFSYTQPEVVLQPSDLYMVNFSGVWLRGMPEPSTLALIGLGLVGLLLCRRK